MTSNMYPSDSLVNQNATGDIPSPRNSPCLVTGKCLVAVLGGKQLILFCKHTHTLTHFFSFIFNAI